MSEPSISEPCAAPAQPCAAISTRPARPEDRNFILKTTLLTLRNSSHLSWYVGNRDFFAGEGPLLDKLLARSSVLVATPADDADLIAGFLVAEPGIAHFLYVKAGLRRQGVAWSLLEAGGLDLVRGFIATAATYDLAKGWIKKKYPAIRFNPYPRWAAVAADSATVLKEFYAAQTVAVVRAAMRAPEEK